MRVNLNNTDNNDYVRGYKDGKIAGATAEAERAQVLIDALDQFISFHESGLLPAKHVYEKAIAARKQWKEGNEDEPVKDDSICGMCKERPKGDGISICNECYYAFDGDRRGFWNSDNYH